MQQVSIHVYLSSCVRDLLQVDIIFLYLFPFPLDKAMSVINLAESHLVKPPCVRQNGIWWDFCTKKLF
jgi:hypothetical protein